MVGLADDEYGMFLYRNGIDTATKSTHSEFVGKLLIRSDHDAFGTVGNFRPFVTTKP